MAEMTGDSMLDLLKEGVEGLEAAGIANARVETELLLAEVLGCERVELYMEDWDISLSKREKFDRMIEKRRTRYPLQYILGWAGFFGMKFRVTPDVLIPRPETEILVETVLRKNLPQPLSRKEGGQTTILDVGTGSGNIAIALAKTLPDAKIYAIDISEEALNIARANARLNKVEDRIEFLQGDVFSTNTDTIVSNPPYIQKGTLKNLPQEVQYEPVAALDGGEDGLDYYRKLIPSARKHLKDGGRVFFEVGDGQAGAVRDLFEDYGYGEIKVFKDLNGIERVVSARS